jgi:hypothetical protein
MADPTVNNDTRTATFTLEDSAGYTLSNTRLEDDHSSIAAASLGLVMQQTTNTADELDDDDFSNWTTQNNLSFVSNIGRFGAGCAKVLRSTGNQSRLALDATGLWTGNQGIIWFKDNGDVFTGSDHLSFLWASNASGTPAIATGFGVDAATSTGNYSYYNLSTGNWTNTGIVRNTNWNKLTVRTGGAVLEGGGGGILQLYLNDALIYNDTEQSPELLRFVANTPTAGKTFYLDRIWHRRNGQLYDLVSTATFPKLQPADVRYWDSYTPLLKSASPSNGYAATGLTMEVQYSADGGANYGTNDPTYTNGLYQSLQTSNVNDGFISQVTGNEAMRMKATLAASTFGTISPRLELVTITWLEELRRYYPFERFT